MAIDIRHPLLRLLGLAWVILSLAYQVILPQRVDVGAPGDEAALRGFYFAERQGDMTFRWSGAEGAVAFDGVGGRPWLLRLRASGMRPTGPAQLKLSVNGQPLVELALGGEMAEREFVISRGQVGTWGNVRIELATDTFTAPPDERKLGLMVDWVELRPAGFAIVTPPWGILAGLLIAVALFFLAVQRLMRSPRPALAAGLLLTMVCAAGVIWARLQVGIVLPWLILGCFLVWAFAGRARRAAWWEWLLFVAMTWSAFRFGARVLDFYRNGLPPGDFTIYFDAAKNLRLGAPLYDFAAASGMPNGPVYKYPPLFAILLAPFTAFPVRSVAAGWYLLNLGLLGLTGYLLARRLQTADLEGLGAYLIAIAWLNFQPAWESLIRGQMDVVILTAAVVALLLIQARRAEGLAGVLLALVTMLKLYPGLLAVYLLWQRRWRPLLAFAIASAALIVLSGAVVGWGTLWRYVSEVLTVQTAAVPWPENQSYDGFLGRLVIPSAATTWYTTIPFPQWARLALYLADFVTLGVTIWVLWRGGRTDDRRFRLGYAAIMPLIVLMWPTAWIHYQTLLLLPVTFLVLDQAQSERRSWGMIVGLLISFVIIAYGNEYTVLIPALQDGLPRLLQSYKLYGVLLLWGLLLWSGR